MSLSPREFYRDLASHLQPWDTLFTWGAGFIPDAISAATHGGPSHVRTIISECGAPHEILLHVEMTWPCARYGTIYEIEPGTPMVVGRHTKIGTVSWRDQTRALDWAERMVILQREYDLGELLVQLSQELGLTYGDWSDRHKTVCSSFNGMLFRLMNIPWTTDPVVSPNDIWMSPLCSQVITYGFGGAV